jgi:hypothetical protein
MPTKEYYIGLITSQYQNSSKFIEWLGDLFQPVADIHTLLEVVDPAFELDVAVGPQLDVLGQEIGLSRRLETTIYVSDVGFTWDDPLLGWGVGVWIYAEQTTLLDLPDDVYRQALKVKIADNYWDGSIPQMYTMWEALFGDDLLIEIQNNLDMTMFVLIYGEVASLMLADLFLNDQISIRPAGVDITYHINPTGHPYFAWGIVHLPMFAGWSEGYWSAGGYLDPVEIPVVVHTPPWLVLTFESLGGDPSLYDQAYSIGPTAGYGGNYELEVSGGFESATCLRMGAVVLPPLEIVFYTSFDVDPEASTTWTEQAQDLTPDTNIGCEIDDTVAY